MVEEVAGFLRVLGCLLGQGGGVGPELSLAKLVGGGAVCGSGGVVISSVYLVSVVGASYVVSKVVNVSIFWSDSDVSPARVTVDGSLRGEMSWFKASTLAP